MSPRDVLAQLIELAEIRREQWQAAVEGTIQDSMNELYEADEQEAAERVECLAGLIDAAKQITVGDWPKLFPDSSAIAAVDYAGDSMVLRVTFRSGVAWDYFGVGDTTAYEFAAADSVGRYFHANIKGKYEGAKVEEGQP